MRRCPGFAIGLSPSNGSPEACASRCRTVEPGGPAGASRSSIPSSAATSTASAVASFVTESHSSSRSRGPWVATTSPGRATPAAACSAPESSTCRSASTRRYYESHGAPAHLVGVIVGGALRLFARGRCRRTGIRERHGAGDGGRRRPAARSVRPGASLPRDPRPGAGRSRRVPERRRPHPHLRHRSRLHGRRHARPRRGLRPRAAGLHGDRHRADRPALVGGDRSRGRPRLRRLLLVATFALLATGVPADAVAPSRAHGLTTYGRTVWNLDALLHNTFGSRQVCLDLRTYSFGSTCKWLVLQHGSADLPLTCS